MSQQFEPGDFLIFQLEAGYGLLKLLAIDQNGGENATWHLSSYEDLFMDVDSADRALANTSSLRLDKPHLALTTRAFLSTQVARMMNAGVSDDERHIVEEWRMDPDRQVHDRSIRLLLGLR